MSIVLAKPNNKYYKIKDSEDSFSEVDNIFAVADGVTRDPKEVLDYRGKSQEEILKYYPHPSGAKKAADIFVNAFSDYIKSVKVISEVTIKEAFLKANNQIKQYNEAENKEVDYLANDFFACVAAAGVIVENQLFWGQICDCGVLVADKNLNVKFRTDDDFEEFHKVLALWEQENGKKEIVWEKPEDRQFWRKEFRNSSKHKVNNTVVSYGALTGEETAKEFIKTGSCYLEKGDMVVFHSDGFKETLGEKTFLESLKRAVMEEKPEIAEEEDARLSDSDYNKFGYERTLIATIKEQE